MLTAVELFAGGGGLAVGLRRAGICPVVAVESDAYAAATFRANHPDVNLIEKDIRTVLGEDLMCGVNNTIDILAACPPCQGFTSLTSKYKRDDERNELISEVSRVARELRPTAIMMENVPGLANRGRPLLDKLIQELESEGYVVGWDILQVADFGVPQTRRRLVLLAGLGFSVGMPRPSHNKEAKRGLPAWKTLRDVIFDRGEALTHDVARARGGFATADWHVVRKLGSRNLERLLHAEPGAARGKLPKSLRPRCHQLSDSGFTNTYGRMAWDHPSVTITAGCLSPSKGRFGHPDQHRTLSIREAALIQTFPASYRFIGDKVDRACAVVGNALPCLFAEVIARQVVKAINQASPWLSGVCASEQ